MLGFGHSDGADGRFVDEFELSMASALKSTATSRCLRITEQMHGSRAIIVIHSIRMKASLYNPQCDWSLDPCLKVR